MADQLSRSRRRSPAVVEAMYPRRSGRSWPRRLPMPSKATAPVCWSCTTSTTCALRTARTTTRSKRSSHHVHGLGAIAPRSRRRTPTSAKFQTAAPRLALGTTGDVHLHVLPAGDRSADRHHRKGCRADRGAGHDGRPGDAARRARKMAEPWKKGVLVVVGGDRAHRIRRQRVLDGGRRQLPRRPGRPPSRRRLALRLTRQKRQRWSYVATMAVSGQSSPTGGDVRTLSGRSGIRTHGDP